MVTYYERKTLPEHKLIPQPETIYDYTRDEDYGIGASSGETLSFLAGGVETLSTPIFSLEEIKTMLRWGARWSHVNVSDTKDFKLYRRLQDILKGMKGDKL